MRVVKQLIFGFLLAIIVFLIVGGLVYYFWPKKPIIPDFKTPAPLKISSLEVFDNGNGTVTVFGEINNPNEHAGVDPLIYTVNLLNNKGKKVFTKSLETFIYPGRNRTIVEPGIDVSSIAVDRGEIFLNNITWRTADKFGDILEKNLAVEDVTIAGMRRGSGFIIKGALKNDNPLQLDKVFIKVILFNKNNLREGVSQTVVANLAAYQSQSFSIQVPMKSDAVARVDSTKTKIILEIER